MACTEGSWNDVEQLLGCCAPFSPRRTSYSHCCCTCESLQHCEAQIHMLVELVSANKLQLVRLKTLVPECPS